MCLYDVSADQLEGAKLAIQQQLEGLEGDGLLREGQTASQLLNAVSFSSDLQDAVSDAGYIQVRVLWVSGQQAAEATPPKMGSIDLFKL